MTILELAENVLSASQVVLCIKRRGKEAEVAGVVKALAYVGFSLVHPEALAFSTQYVLLGLEL